MKSNEYKNKSASSFKELIVWQKAHLFVLGVYSLTGSFPKSEIYGLTSQFRRAAISIASNIAEGFIKKNKVFKYIAGFIRGMQILSNSHK